MSADAERDTIHLPATYGIYEYEGYRMIGDGDEEFFISNRNFEAIDSFFSQGISKSICRLLDKSSDKKVRILDLAGGIESQASKDIKEKFGDGVQAVNIDIAHNVQKGQGADRAQGDATRLPIANSCVDIIYSYQFLPFLRRFGSGHTAQIKKTLSETTRVLKPGGIAFLDDEEEFSGTKSEKKLKELSDELGITIEAHESIYVKQESHLPKFWKKELRPAKFLIIKKPLSNQS